VSSSVVTGISGNACRECRSEEICRCYQSSDCDLCCRTLRMLRSLVIESTSHCYGSAVLI